MAPRGVPWEGEDVGALWSGCVSLQRVAAACPRHSHASASSCRAAVCASDPDREIPGQASCRPGLPELPGDLPEPRFPQGSSFLPSRGPDPQRLLSACSVPGPVLGAHSPSFLFSSLLWSHPQGHPGSGSWGVQGAELCPLFCGPGLVASSAAPPAQTRRGRGSLLALCQGAGGTPPPRE